MRAAGGMEGQGQVARRQGDRSCRLMRREMWPKLDAGLVVYCEVNKIDW